jgi:hypothetical protein
MASSLLDFGIFVPGVGVLLSIIAILLLMVWDILVASRLFQLAQVGDKKFVSIARNA